VSLKGANLSRANLTDADFRGGVMLDSSGSTSIGRRVTDIADCICDYASATRAKMAGVDLRGASFVGANLDGANLFGADLSDVNLSFASLKGADLSESRLGQTKFAGADLSGARLNNAVSENTMFGGATMDGATMDGIDTGRCKFDEQLPLVPSAQFPRHIADLLDAHERWIGSGGKDGQRAVLERTDMSYFDLSGRDFSGAKITRCKLVGAKLTGTLLVLADLSASDFLAADLSGAALLGTVFDGANFTRAKLVHAMAGAIDILDGSGKRTGRQQLTSFVGANLHAAETTGLDLAKCRVNPE